MKHILLILLIVSSCNLFAQQKKLFLILVHQPPDSVFSENLGTSVNRENIKMFANYISQRCSMQVLITEFDATACTVKNDVMNYITGISTGTDDVIWFYYTGQGSNCDGYPKTSYDSLCQSAVHQHIKSKNVRLTITMFDICNNLGATLYEDKIFMRTDGDDLKFLFFDAKGEIKSCSSKPGQSSYCSSDAGGYYTISFLHAIHEKLGWNEIFEMTKTNTIKFAEKINGIQEPLTEYNLTYAGIYPVSDFVAIVREGETLEMLCKRVHDKLNVDETGYDFLTLSQFTQKVREWNHGKINTLKKGTLIDIRVSQFKLK